MFWPYRVTVLQLCMFAFFGTMVARLAISPVVPQITAEFAVSNTLIGVALTGMWLAYALSQFPSGILSDRFGEKIVILVAIGGTGIASLLIALAPVFAIFIACTVVIGAAAGLHYTPATALLARMFDEKGTALGYHNLGGPLAGLVTPIVVVWIALRFGWRPAVAIAFVVAVPVFLLVLLRIEPTPAQRPDVLMRKQLQLNSLNEAIMRPPVAFTIGIAVLHLFVWQGVASFLPTFLIEYRGMTTGLAGVMFSMYFVIQGIMGIVIGAFSDRYGNDPAIAVAMSTAVIGFVMLITASSVWTVALSIALLGSGMSGYPPILTRFVEMFEVAERGFGIGLVRSVSGTIGASGSFGVGLFADLFGWGVSFGILGALLVCVLGMLGVNRLLRLNY